MPPGLASCGSVHGETDIEQYLIEAHRQVALCKSLGVLWMCDSSSTISAAPLSHDQSCDKGAEEGVFLSALLNKLERLLDQVDVCVCVCVCVVLCVCVYMCCLIFAF